MRTFDDISPVLRQLGRAMTKYAMIDRKPYDFGVGVNLYPAEIHMITAVARMDGVGVTDLAREVGVTKGAVSQQVAKLVEKGFLAKQPDPENNSRVRITVTDQGRKASECHCDFHREHDRVFLDYLASLDEVSFSTVAGMADEMNSWMDRYLK